MNTEMVIRFLRGEFDPEYKKVTMAQRLEQAKLNKPETRKMQVYSDWAFSISYGGKPKVPPKPKPERKAATSAGIYPTKNGRFQAQFKAFGTFYYLGIFDTEEEAAKVRAEAKDKLKRGEFKYKGQLVVDTRERAKLGLPQYIHYRYTKRSYMVQKRINGKVMYLGSFKTLEEAEAKLREVDSESRSA